VPSRALFERERSGLGQVIDAAIVDGAALLTAFVRGLREAGSWPGPRGTNLFDSGAHFYEVYETADGKWVSVGALEPQFYATLLRVLGLVGDEPLVEGHMDRERWVALKPSLAEVFKTKTRDEWTALFAGEPESCFAPVLDLDDAARDAHLRERETYIGVGAVDQPAPAPRFDRTPTGRVTAAVPPGHDTESVLAELGCLPDEIAALRASGAID
jgi:alpha-methylacyl-CoA racemase